MVSIPDSNPPAQGNGTRVSKAAIETATERPVALSVKEEGIPQKLRERDQWLCWSFKKVRNKSGNEKWSKIPVYALSGGPASTTDPATWTSFATALAYYHDHRDSVDGIGFVLSEDDPFCGIDLDDCRNLSTKEVDPWAREVVADLDTYTEISPTRTGLKLITKAKLPGKGNRKDQIELYDHARFFCITGRRLKGTPATVNKRQKALDRLHASLFPPKQAKPAAAKEPVGPPPGANGHDSIRGDLNLFLSNLQGVSPSAKGYAANCPAHGDRNPSLSIDQGSDGRILLHCHAGCSAQAVVGALGLSMSDLFPSRNGRTQPRKPKHPEPKKPSGKAYVTAKEALSALDDMMKRKHQGERAGKWRYRDAGGNLVALVLRFDLPTEKGQKQAKTFRPVSRWEDGWHLCDPEQWPLYRVNELSAAEVVYVVEGEKCADSLMNVGITATTSAHGSQSPHRTDWSPLAGKTVIVLPDNDAAGDAYATAVTAILSKLSPQPQVTIEKAFSTKE
jgi:hypothetical protein